MRNYLVAAPLIALMGFTLHPAVSFAQAESSTVATAAVSAEALPPVAAVAAPSAPAAAIPAAATSLAGEGGVLSRVGVGISLSPTLGPGLETAYELTHRINVRGGFNFFKYTDNFDRSGVNYGGSLKFESGQVSVDYFLWGSLHVSPGLLFSDREPLTASLGVPGGQTFTLSGTTYESNPSNPLGGTGALKFNAVAPSILFGFGNLVPRSERRFSMEFELGGAYRGTPATVLNFTGSACDQTGAFCQPVATYTAFQSSVAAQQTKFNNDISFLKFYPIISLGFGFRL